MTPAEPTFLRVLDAASMPFDAVRRRAFAVLGRSLTRTLGTRDLRVPLVACVQIALFFVIAVAAPVLSFVVGPLLLGVPHLASDVRYLLLRARVSRPVVLASVLAVVVLVGARLAALHGHGLPHAATLELAVGLAWVGLAFVKGAREGARPVSTVVLGLLGLGLAGSWMLQHVAATRLILAHGHNVFGIGVWFVLFRRNKRFAALPLLAIAAATALLLAGTLLPLTLRLTGDAAFGLRLGTVARGLAPGLSPQQGAAVVMSFVFLQSVHYATWLVWVPQESLPGQGTFTFRMTGRSLFRDFGPVLLLAFAALWIGLLGWGAVDPLRALMAYVSLVSFHAWLELALAAYLLVRRP